MGLPTVGIAVDWGSTGLERPTIDVTFDGIATDGCQVSHLIGSSYATCHYPPGARSMEIRFGPTTSAGTLRVTFTEDTCSEHTTACAVLVVHANATNYTHPPKRR